MLYFLLATSYACTMWAAGKKATKTGATMLVGSDDGEGSGDPRLVHVPPADYKEGAKRPVYFDEEDFPRYVGYARGPAYYPVGDQKIMEPIGYIDQVSHTFGYYEGTYGIANEKNIGIVESTCSARYFVSPRKPGETTGPIWSIDELSRVAMERATTARDAVLLMGKLAEEGGFYGVAAEAESAGESLFISDPDEVWLFHILAAPNDSAVWVAKQVPDTDIAACPNIFVIRDISDALHSANLYSVAKALGLWNEGEEFDFVKVYSNGEYCSPFYNGRRLWRIFDLAAPSLSLSPTYKNLRLDAPYPFSVTPDNPVDRTLGSRIMRDYYNGTAYDLSTGLAAGPWGSPLRASSSCDCTGNETSFGKGSFERSIGIHRMSHSVIIESRSDKNDLIATRVWLGQHAAWGTVYIPVYAAAASLEYKKYPVPRCVSDANPFEPSKVMWWAGRRVSNVCYGHWSKYHPIVEELQYRLEKISEHQMDKLEANFTSLLDLVAWSTHNADDVLNKWWELVDRLIMYWGDGFGTNPVQGILGELSGYSYEWLEAVGYFRASMGVAA